MMQGNLAETLYVFLHIPKTAGSTFRAHLEKNFPAHALLPVYTGGAGYTNVKTGARDYFSNRGDIDAYLASLSEEERNKISVVYGHDVYFGIHTFFNRPVRYVTFVRHPRAQRVSFYNFYRGVLDGARPHPFLDVDDRRRAFLTETWEDLTEGGTVVPFTRWLRNRAWHRNYMVSFLRHRQFLVDGESYTDALRRFYFVGTTERYAVDGPFLYQVLGIRRFVKNQNVSQNYVALTDEDEREVQQNHALDLSFYEAAVAYNLLSRRRYHATFVVARSHVWRAIDSIRRNWYVCVRCAYRLSAFFKRHSALYGQLVRVLKQPLWKK